MEELVLNNTTRAELDLKKLDNIHSFCSLPREGLSWNKHERRLLLYETENKEYVFIRYPGKESDPSFIYGGRNRRLNPYDFKPDLVLANGHSVKPGTNYVLGLMIESFVKKRYRYKRLIISFLLSMAYYNFHEWGIYGTFTQDVYFWDGKIFDIQRYKEIDFVWSKQILPEEILRIIRDVKVTYDERTLISAEALIHYIDVLAMQEDCKYQRGRTEDYYSYNKEENRNVYDTVQYEKDSYRNDEKYSNHIGRINFISTLARVAYYTSAPGQKRRKELSDLLNILKANCIVKPIP